MHFRSCKETIPKHQQQMTNITQKKRLSKTIETEKVFRKRTCEQKSKPFARICVDCCSLTLSGEGKLKRRIKRGNNKGWCGDKSSPLLRE
jgi:3-dehydroquinate synthase class II